MTVNAIPARAAGGAAGRRAAGAGGVGAGAGAAGFGAGAAAGAALQALWCGRRRLREGHGSEEEQTDQDRCSHLASIILTGRQGYPDWD